ncbi:hypothetical protein BDE02_07G035900 [Populus trichocarpa]|nr:hypothetical protein BDE02_07G035900 [Populus trichocarpa]
MELSLDLSLVCEPKTINECLKEVSMVKDGSQKLTKLYDYVERLEDERRKIDAFKRELPLCMLLLNEAIARLKEEAMQCSELNDLIPLKGNSNEDGNDKKNWMSSVQLWNTNNQLDCKKQDSKSEPKQKSEEDDDRSTCENPVQLGDHSNKGEAFVPFKALSGFEGSKRKEEKEVVSQVTGLSPMTPVPDLSSCNWTRKSNNCSNQTKILSKSQQQAYRKQRRCWSPELHRRFVDALQQLGGCQVATPKQIREHMQVDGLTNDEVKSHLQKYRLHLRKVPASPAAPASQDQCKDPSTGNISQSNSPKGSLHASGSAKATSNTGGDSMEAEDDDKSESHSWNGALHKPGEAHV